MGRSRFVYKFCKCGVHIDKCVNGHNKISTPPPPAASSSKNK